MKIIKLQYKAILNVFYIIFSKKTIASLVCASLVVSSIPLEAFAKNNLTPAGVTETTLNISFGYTSDQKQPVPQNIVDGITESTAAEHKSRKILSEAIKEFTGGNRDAMMNDRKAALYDIRHYIGPFRNKKKLLTFLDTLEQDEIDELIDPHINRIRLDEKHVKLSKNQLQAIVKQLTVLFREKQFNTLPKWMVFLKNKFFELLTVLKKTALGIPQMFVLHSQEKVEEEQQSVKEIGKEIEKFGINGSIHEEARDEKTVVEELSRETAPKAPQKEEEILESTELPREKPQLEMLGKVVGSQEDAVPMRAHENDEQVLAEIEHYKQVLMRILEKRPDLKNITINITTGSGNILTTDRDKKQAINFDKAVLEALLDAKEEYHETIIEKIGAWFVDHGIRELLAHQEAGTRGPPEQYRIAELANTLIDIRNFLLMPDQTKDALLSLLSSANLQGLDAHSFLTVLNEARRRFDNRMKKGANPGPAAKATALSMLYPTIKFYGLRNISAKAIRERVRLAYGIIDRAERIQFLKSIGADIELKYVLRLINSRIDLEERAKFIKAHDLPVTARNLTLSGDTIIALSDTLALKRRREEAKKIVKDFVPQKQDQFLQDIFTQYRHKLAEMHQPTIDYKIELLMDLVAEGLAVYISSDLETPKLETIMRFIQEKVLEEEDLSGVSEKERSERVQALNRKIEERVHYYLTGEGQGTVRELARKYLYRDGSPVLK
ncbi:MAG: hypothetical protein GF384_07355, partial [Elusimicrobia bacterium]|nr:hypothetical protein [Elusimicrobiota bacterium]